MQALNYKWNGKFATTTQGGKSYDTSTIFKCRNAAELNDLLTQMQDWDNTRATQTTSQDIYTDISLKEKILARNPSRFQSNPADPGTRADDSASPRPMPLPAVPTVQYFRNLLTRKYKNGGGNLIIPFSTIFSNQNPDWVDGNFFRGASYDQNGLLISPGFWREKIVYLKVNIIASDAPPSSGSLGGFLTYGGATYFHTRVPPRSDRTVAATNNRDDAPGELLVAPFRFWSSPDFSANGFQATSQQTQNIAVAYSQNSVFDANKSPPDQLNSSFQFNAFAGRSIAASGWTLQIPLNQGGTVYDPNKFKDIEIIVHYTHSDRVAPTN
jgi:hypothetical protein